MKYNNDPLYSQMTPLSDTEMIAINGGMGFWETVGYIGGLIVGSCIAVGRASAEYQASLPPNLKK